MNPWLFPWLLSALFVLGACAKAPREDEALTQREQVLTADLTAPALRQQALGWVADVRQAHLEADRLERMGEIQAALALLNRTLERQVPIGVGSWHKSTARRDLYGHAARLALALKLSDEASRLIEAGLAVGERADDPLHTKLLILAIDLAQASDDPEAVAKARREARAALEHARP
jgi:hypothetical protein